MNRICMFAEKLPPEFTGSGKQAIFLLRALQQKGLSVIGLCSSSSGKYFKGDVDGVEIAYIGSSRNERMRSIQFAFSAIFWLVRNKKLYDILHVHGYCVAALPALIVAKILSKKAIYKITLTGEDDPKALKNSRCGLVKESLLKYFDAMIAISERVLETVSEFQYPVDKVYLIPNGVEDRFKPDNNLSAQCRNDLCDRLGIERTRPIVLYIGSIEYRKGIDVLAKAWINVQENMSNACLVLVGPYNEHEPFYGWFAELLKDAIGKSVFLTGKVKDTLNYYLASDIFVFPSRNESFGNVLLEAMACGNACVATNIEGVTENIINNGSDGIIVEQENDQELAEAIIQLLTNSSMRKMLSSNAVKTVDSKFRMKIIADKYIDLYQKL